MNKKCPGEFLFQIAEDTAIKSAVWGGAFYKEVGGDARQSLFVASAIMAGAIAHIRLASKNYTDGEIDEIILDMFCDAEVTAKEIMPSVLAEIGDGLEVPSHE